MEDGKKILDSIRVLVRAIRVSSRACEASAGRSGAQIFVLEQLHRAGRLSVNELAERTFTHQSTVSVVVGRLIADGLVSRARSKADARRIELALTPKGARAFERAPRTAQQDLARAIGALDVQKRKRLGALLHDLVAAAGFDEARPPLLFEDDARERKKKNVRA
ncbi:MAG: MarR family transcriptional regulator [Bdellovibrionales bacterium]|nr:MarR family transcriptional regulator [Bdellovibrionales bacterium]